MIRFILQHFSIIPARLRSRARSVSVTAARRSELRAAALERWEQGSGAEAQRTDTTRRTPRPWSLRPGQRDRHGRHRAS